MKTSLSNSDKASLFNVNYGPNSKIDSIIDQLKQEGMKRGDIVTIIYHINEDFMAIYDGTKLQPFISHTFLGFPREYEVIEEFPIRFWSKIAESPMAAYARLYEGIYVPFNPQPYAQQILDNFQIVQTSPPFPIKKYNQSVEHVLQVNSGYNIYHTFFLHPNSCTYTILIIVPHTRLSNTIIPYLLEQRYFSYLSDDIYKLPNLKIDLSPYNPELTLVLIDNFATDILTNKRSLTSETDFNHINLY